MLNFPLGILECSGSCVWVMLQSWEKNGDLYVGICKQLQELETIGAFFVYFVSMRNFKMLKMPSLQILSQRPQTRHSYVGFVWLAECFLKN